MLRVSVELRTIFSNVGDFIADLQAMDAAGADTLWFHRDPRSDPWVLAAAAAAVTHHARIGVRDDDAMARKALPALASTLARVAGGRLAVGAISARDNGAFDELAQVLRVLPALPTLVAFIEGDIEASAARQVDAVVDASNDIAATRDLCRLIRDLREETGAIEIWARAAMPADRAAWTKLRADYVAAGVTGLVLPFDDRLIDLLRNPDVEDDRSDLLIASG